MTSYFIETALTLPIVYAIILTMLETRYSRLFSYMMSIVAVAISMVLDTILLLSGVDTIDIYTFSPITACVPGFLCFYILSKHRDASFLFTYLTATVAATIATVLSHIFTWFLPLRSNPLRIFVHFLILFILFLLSDKYVGQYYKIASAATDTYRKIWRYFLIFPILCYVLWGMFVIANLN